MKKSFIFGTIIFSAFVAFLYISMLRSTNMVKLQVEMLLKGEIDPQETENLVIDIYNRQKDMSRSDGRIAVEKRAEVKRIFVLHDFFAGYMWVKYSYEAKDIGGNILCGTGNAIARWKIHRENGKWEIVDIKEAP